MQVLLILACLVVAAAGAEYAMKFSARSRSSVWIGNVEQTQQNGSKPGCRACAIKNDLCYPTSSASVLNFTNLVLPQQFLTLETWVRFDELNSTTNLISATDGVEEARNMEAGGFRLGFFRGFPTFGVAVASTSYGGPSQDLLAVSGPAAQNWVMGRWYHFAGTWDGVHRKLYVDGELIDAHKPAYAPSMPNYTTAQFTLGGSASCDIQVGFTGALAEVRMWDRARSGSEIAAGMRQRLEGNETGLIGLWREVSDGFVEDLSGHQPAGNATAVEAELLSSFPPPQTLPQWDERGDSACVPFTEGGGCEAVVDYPYFAPNNTWQQRISDVYKGIGALKSILSPACFSAVMPHFCGMWFPRCLLRNVTMAHQYDPTISYSSTLEFETWVPLPISAESCLALSDACKVEIASLGSIGLRGAFLLAIYHVKEDDDSTPNSDCLGSWLVGKNGNETERGIVFPHHASLTHTFGPFRFDEPFAAPSAVVQSGATKVCDYPFVERAAFTPYLLLLSPSYIEDQQRYLASFKNLTVLTPEVFENSPYCVKQCPPALMSSSQYYDYTRTTGGLAVFSFGFSACILLFLLRDPTKRKFPGNLMVLVLASVLGLSFALSLSLFGGWDKYFCLNQHNDRATQGASSLCDTQAVLLQFFLATLQGYWCAMCVFLYTVLKMQPSTKWKLFTFIPLIPAVLSVILLAALGEIGLASSANICWVNAEQPALSWSLYYVPGLLNVIFSTYIVICYASNRREFTSDPAFFRMLQITILLLIAAIFSIVAESDVSANYPKYIYNSAAYLKCRNLALAFGLFRDLHDPRFTNWREFLEQVRTTGGFDASGDPNSCPSYDPGLQEGVLYINQLVLASLGTLVPLILLAKQVKSTFRCEHWSSTKLMLSGGGGSDGSSNHRMNARSSQVSTKSLNENSKSQGGAENL